jgi:phospholipase C
MFSRREFMTNSAFAAGAAGMIDGLLASIQRAFAIEPEKGSTYLDAEHVVILMQENRSFDHVFGTLRGVRGFDDPRAITLPDGNPVWVQATASGERFVPFRLNIKDTKSTWMSCLPHGWTDQVDARNHGKYDRWLQVKKSGTRAYASMPLTLGHYTREDVPFYYALADAFTICDQHFCSSLTGTTPNRLHLWTGTIRAKPTPDSPALVLNSDAEFGTWVSWTTFPERLEDHGISWKIYQNELGIESGFTDEEYGWLSNFGDNPIEYLLQFQVRYAATHRSFVESRVKAIPGEIESLQKQLAEQSGNASEKTKKRIAELKDKLREFEQERGQFTAEGFDKLSPREKSLHRRAFVTNVDDPDYRKLVDLSYRDGDNTRQMKVPSGDLFFQFRKDVISGNLPAVSWIVSPQEFSDHPSSAWYGAWYISEIVNILTQNPNVWKKTIFILTYDENDGYFDHVPPFTAPHPRRPETGRVTKGIDVAVEFVELEQDKKNKPIGEARESSIGLGYRVPMIIASPWSRGGCVCSQVFDHTSVLQFLEKLLTHRTGKKIEETNISRWRRAVCGDLTTSFQSPGDGSRAELPFLKRDEFVESIHQAQFKALPTGFHALSKEEIQQIRENPRAAAFLTHQEPGIRRSSPLPYQLVVNGSLDNDRKRFRIQFEASNEIFGARSCGSPFIVYAVTENGTMSVRNYAVEAGQSLEDSWELKYFSNAQYHLRVYGPNGFYREFIGSSDNPDLSFRIDYLRANGGKRMLSGALELTATNRDDKNRYTMAAVDNAYKNAEQSQMVPGGKQARLILETDKSHGWYDFSIRIVNAARFTCRFAGRVETGNWSFSDPAMG